MRDAGAHLLFPLPYNNIEMSYAKLKTVFRKADMRTIGEAWPQFSELLGLFSPDACARYIRHA